MSLPSLYSDEDDGDREKGLSNEMLPQADVTHESKSVVAKVEATCNKNEVTAVDRAGLSEKDGSVLADNKGTESKEAKHSSDHRLDEAEVSWHFFFEDGDIILTSKTLTTYST